MLKQPMIEKLAAMRLLSMVEVLKTQEQDPAASFQRNGVASGHRPGHPQLCTIRFMTDPLSLPCFRAFRFAYCSRQIDETTE